jgi:hypothetical protein
MRQKIKAILDPSPAWAAQPSGPQSLVGIDGVLAVCAHGRF